MQCLIPKENIKTFCCCMQCIAKIGKDVMVEAFADKICFRTLNDSHSSFIGFTFPPNFFTEYEIEGSSASKKFKFSVKACQPIFKSMKSVEGVKLALTDSVAEGCVSFELICRYGITKLHEFSLDADYAPLVPVYDRAAMRNMLIARPAILIRHFDHFRAAMVNLRMFHDNVRVLSFHETERERSFNLHTRLTIMVEDFSGHRFDAINQDVTFSLKEVRAFLTLCRSLNTEQVGFYGDSPGCAVEWALEDTGRGVSVSLIVATQKDSIDDHDQPTPSVPRSAAPPNSFYSASQQSARPVPPAPLPAMQTPTVRRQMHPVMSTPATAVLDGALGPEDVFDNVAGQSSQDTIVRHEDIVAEGAQVIRPPLVPPQALARQRTLQEEQEEEPEYQHLPYRRTPGRRQRPVAPPEQHEGSKSAPRSIPSTHVAKESWWDHAVPPVDEEGSATGAGRQTAPTRPHRKRLLDEGFFEGGISGDSKRRRKEGESQPEESAVVLDGQPSQIVSIGPSQPNEGAWMSFQPDQPPP